MGKRIFPVFAAVFLLLTAPVFAEGTIQVKVEPGFDGIIRPFRWAPVAVTVTNRAGTGSGGQGKAYSGELAVKVAPEDNRFATYLFPMDLPSGVSKKVTLFVPVFGNGLNPGKIKVEFYEGGIERGRAVEGVEVEAFTTSTLPLDQGLIGALTEDPDGIKYFLRFDAGGKKYSLAFLDKERFPEQAIGLDALDLLIINRFPADSLNPAQLAAIREWVQGGGTLVLGGGGSYRSTLLPLQDLSPVKAEGTVEGGNLSALSAYAGEALPSAGKAVFTRGKLAEGKVLVAQGDIPLIAFRDFGRGKVIYAAFDLASDPFSAWKGSGKLWGRILVESKAVRPVQGEKIVYQPYDIVNAVDYFPGVRFPSLRALFFAYLAYILLVSFVLYFILKRLDRREWLWFAAPVCAVVFSAVIFAVGASGRIHGILRNTVAFVELDGEGTGSGQAASAIFVPGSGDYRIESDLPVFPAQDFYLQDPLQEAGSVLIYPGEEPRLEFRDVDYWSLHKFYAELRAQPYGLLASDLSVENGVLKGTITNKTEFDLKEAYLFAGTRQESLGELKRGESKRIELKLGTGGIQDLSPSSGFSQRLAPGNPLQEDWRKIHLSYSLEPLEENRNVPYPLLAAWVEDPLFRYEVNGQIYQDHYLSLVVQYLPVSFGDENRFAIRHGDVAPQVAVGSELYTRIGGGNEVVLAAGQAVLDYRLPLPGEGLAEELEVNVDSGGKLRYEIYQWEPQSWIEIEKSRVLDNPQAYVRNNTIRLRITSSTDQRFMEPTVAVKGVVKGD